MLGHIVTLIREFHLIELIHFRILFFEQLASSSIEIYVQS